MTDSLEETLDYLRSVIGDRSEVSWFTDSITGSDQVTGPMDVFLRTTAGEVTWGWSVAPIPADTAERSFRRFRSEDDVMLVDAQEPEMIFLPHSTDLHTLSHGGRAAYSLALDAGDLPDSSQSFDMEKQARSGAGRYSIDPAWHTAHVSRILALWVESLIGADVHFEWAEATDEDLTAIDELAGGADIDPAGEWTALDEEIAEIVAGFESIAWIQADLTWPDADNTEAFRDHIDAQFRSPTEGLVYLAAIDPVGAGTDPILTELGDGSTINFDGADPTLIGLMPDRMVLALNRQADGFEPAGLAVPWGSPPTSEEWAELRRFKADHPDTILIHTIGWSETRVSDALTAWAEWWGGADVEFAYDYEDPMPQAAISRNEVLAETPVAPETFVRTSTVNRCMYVPTDTAPNEDPFPCGRPATHYYTPSSSPEGVVLVCSDHVPRGGIASPLLK